MPVGTDATQVRAAGGCYHPPPMASPRMRRLLRAVLAMPLIIGASCVFGSKDSTQEPPTTSSPATVACRLQPDPAVSGIHGNQLAAVAGVSPDDIWAVGSHFEVSKSGPLAQHWNGSAWDTLMAGNQLYNGLQLTDVDPIAADDVWTVGFSYGGASSLHWDGSSWTEVPAAKGFAGAVFLGVAGVSPTDLWVVGKATAAGGYDIPIAQRSDGSRWSAVPVPQPAGIAAGLRDVSASGPGSAWAVGWSVDDQKVFRPLVEHWDGSRWSIQGIPEPSTDALLSGVVAVGPDDVWAVGWSWNGDATTSLVLHWNGQTWSRVTLPAGPGGTAKLATVTAQGDAVAVAGQGPDEQGILQPVVLRLEGTTWTDHATPVDPSGGGFQGLMLLGKEGMIAVGSQIAADGYGSLVQKGC
jgi:hypothetical protein